MTEDEDTILLANMMRRFVGREGYVHWSDNQLTIDSTITISVEESDALDRVWEATQG